MAAANKQQASAELPAPPGLSAELPAQLGAELPANLGVELGSGHAGPQGPGG
eukprot:COSAG01_NODE_49037_length_375_cov_2.427536_1_plen_51_part_10